MRWEVFRKLEQSLPINPVIVNFGSLVPRHDFTKAPVLSGKTREALIVTVVDLETGKKSRSNEFMANTVSV